MRRQRSVIILLALAAVLAAAANLGGNVITDQLPPELQANALRVFGLATLAELIATIYLDRLEKAERTLLRQALAIGLICLGAVAAALGGVVSNAAAAALPDTIRPYVAPNVVPLLIVVTILTIVIAVALYRLSGVLRLTPNYRKAFLSTLCERYTRRLRDALGDAAHIDLQLRVEAQATAQPPLTQQEVEDGLDGQQDGQEQHAGASISSVYDAAHEELLILGEPGAGKSTLLVELAVALVGRAETSKILKMPVIFSLASWAVERLPLAKWMAAELAETYQMPLKVAAAWVEAEEILPLLDGLDEVAEEHRAACAGAIETYHREHERVGLVVCSRRAEYFALPTRLHLRTAVVVQPLTDQQIDYYLTQGKGLEGLRDALATDAELHSAARTPLMLGIIRLIYLDGATGALARLGKTSDWRRALFGEYVAHMLTRRRGHVELGSPEVSAGRAPTLDKARWASYSDQETLHYLAWLATQMKAHNQQEFDVERLQMDWLSGERARTSYRRSARIGYVLSTELPEIAFEGALGGLIGGIGFGLLGALAGAVIFGVVSAGLLLARMILEPSAVSSDTAVRMLERMTDVRWSSFPSHVGPLLLATSRYALIGGVVGGLQGGPVLGLVLGVTTYGLLKAPLNLLRVLGFRDAVQTWYYWSWRRRWFGLLGAFVVGIYGGMLGALVGRIYGQLVFVLVLTVAAFGLLEGLELGVYGFLQASIRAIMTAPRAWRTLVRYLLTIVLNIVSGGAFGLAIGVLLGLTVTGLYSGLLVGALLLIVPVLVLNVIRGRSYRLSARILHAKLLRQLERAGNAPADYVRFLDFAADHVLLLRVENSYRFIHALLLDYFADLWAETEERTAGVSSQT